MLTLEPPLKLPPPWSECQSILTSDWVLVSLEPASPRATAAASTNKNKDATRATSSPIQPPQGRLNPAITNIHRFQRSCNLAILLSRPSLNCKDLSPGPSHQIKTWSSINSPPPYLLSTLLRHSKSTPL
jgi:hypothetical protein